MEEASVSRSEGTPHLDNDDRFWYDVIGAVNEFDEARVVGRLTRQCYNQLVSERARAAVEDNREDITERLFCNLCRDLKDEIVLNKIKVLAKIGNPKYR